MTISTRGPLGRALFFLSWLSVAPAFAAAPSAPTNVVFVERTETSAHIRWTPSPEAVQGYKVRRSETPGVHPNAPVFPDGKTWAFTWTTDDGLTDNLVYEPIFSSRGLRFSAFLNGARIGLPGKITWDDVRYLYSQGHEIGNHGADHLALIDDRAFTVRYLGPEACDVQVTALTLETRIVGVPDLVISLNDAASDHLVELSALIDAHPNYESTLLYSDIESSASSSHFLDPVTIPIGMGAPAGTLTTERGVHDEVEMLDQIVRSAENIEDEVRMLDPSYACRTLAYPNHAHTQVVMTLLNQLGYAGARSGIVGARPFFSEGSFATGFTTTYEVPMNTPRPINSWDEAFTRSKYQARIASWKAGSVWVVLMAHSEAESDSLHVEWMMDEIAADPDVWIAPFGEVNALMNELYVDAGVPVDSSGMASAWVHDLDPGTEYHVVVTAYNVALEESGWSNEVVVPAYAVVESPLATLDRGAKLRAAPDPFTDQTRLGFTAKRSGPAALEVYDVRGARLSTTDLGEMGAGEHSVLWRGTAGHGPLPGGVYFVRVSGPEWSSTRRVVLLR